MTTVFASHRTAVLVSTVLLLAIALLMFATSGATEPMHMPAPVCPPQC